MPFYRAEFEFTDERKAVHSTYIIFEEVEDRKVLVAAVKRWMDWRKASVGDWFNTFLAVSIYGLGIERIEDSGRCGTSIRHLVYEWKIDRGPYGARLIKKETPSP